jgi:hypothetical protein
LKEGKELLKEGKERLKEGFNKGNTVGNKAGLTRREKR